MAAREDYAYRLRRSEDGKKKKSYKYNLNVPGASQHVDKFLSDFKPSELTRTAGYSCLEIGFYSDEVPANPALAKNQGTDQESPVAEPQPDGAGPDGDGAPEQDREGQFDKESTSQFYVVYRQTSIPDSTSNDAGAAGQELDTWVHDFIPKGRRSQEKQELRDQLKTEIDTQKESEQGLTKQSLLTLGKQYKDLHGAWMFHVASGDQVDFMWRKLALALAEGKLSAKKIQVVAKDDVIKSVEQIISSHCADFSSQECVFQLEREMRQVGMVKSMSFKPVIYSHACIYKGNPWGISPSLYTSKFDVKSRISAIQKTDSDASHSQQI